MLVQRIQPQFVVKTTQKAVQKNSSKAAEKLANVSLPRLEALTKPGYLQYLMGSSEGGSCVSSYGDLLPMGFSC